MQQEKTIALTTIRPPCIVPIQSCRRFDSLGRNFHHRPISKDNLLIIFGPDSISRNCDCAAPGRIFFSSGDGYNFDYN
ncbi:MAG TPA: hypothetical protein VLS45_02300 [Methylomicrobium sp.]|nr:hypothetical protein [Methylomicrobium sp.]